MEAVVIEETGGIDVLKFVTDAPKPIITSPNQVIVQVHYASVNFIDTYFRNGLYKADKYPFTLGSDATGVVTNVGDSVKNVKVGDRVGVYGRGCYAEYVAVGADKVVKIPDNVPLDSAVACMVNGMTAHYLVHDCHPVSKESSVLVHAAAGGTGQLITQICRIKGAKNIIGTVGSEEKATLAKNFGATHTIVYSKAGVVVSDEVRKIVPSGVNVVYDGVGASTWEQSMKSVGRRGDVVFFGNASGPVPPVDPLLLTKYGSIRMTRPSLVDFTVTEEETDRRAQDLFRWVASGELKVNIHKSFNLQDVKLAHQEIESRAAVGKIVLRVLKSLRK